MALEFPIELQFRNVDFWEGRKTGEAEKNPRSKDENQQQTHGNIWRESNPGHIGGRQALTPLRHPCSPQITSKNTQAACSERKCLLSTNKYEIMLVVSGHPVSNMRENGRYAGGIGG